MEKENIIPKKRIPGTVYILILLAFAATSMTALLWLRPYENRSPVLVYFLGINLTLLVIGSLSLSYCIIRQWTICIDHDRVKAEKEAENCEKDKTQKLLKEDADQRRSIERERNPVNDLFRMAELSKVKTEKTIVRKESEKSKEPDTISETDKREETDTQKLNELSEHYQNLISTQQAKTP